MLLVNRNTESPFGASDPRRLRVNSISVDSASMTSRPRGENEVGEHLWTNTNKQQGIPKPCVHSSSMPISRASAYPPRSRATLSERRPHACVIIVETPGSLIRAERTYWRKRFKRQGS